MDCIFAVVQQWVSCVAILGMAEAPDHALLLRCVPRTFDVAVTNVVHWQETNLWLKRNGRNWAVPLVLDTYGPVKEGGVLQCPTVTWHPR